ncbi:MAG: 23S rRNA (guanosine(2251)-2'-O)-methyltransferase RlmB, partial [Clostridia bacterium]|nr:23S rRNA (guanosine(2251)-2'-O)-methyltransferase RlmB [Clostridia bacterium]
MKVENKKGAGQNARSNRNFRSDHKTAGRNGGARRSSKEGLRSEKAFRSDRTAQSSRQDRVFEAEAAGESRVKEEGWGTERNFRPDKNLEKRKEDLLLGRNPVREALKSGRSLNRILLAEESRGNILKELIGLAKVAHIPMQWVEKEKLDRLTGGANHQGIVAYAAAQNYWELEDLLAQAGEKPFLLVLDEINDPHNLGAILRSAEACGVKGAIIPKRRSASLNSTVLKTSAGAAEYIPVARVANLASTLDWLKKQGLWVVGADMGGQVFWQEKLELPLAVVIGGEGQGLSRLIKEKCDLLVQ